MERRLVEPHCDCARGLVGDLDERAYFRVARMRQSGREPFLVSLLETLRALGTDPLLALPVWLVYAPVRVMGDMGAAIGDRPANGKRPLVFVSYSREDGEWCRRFVEMLAPAVRRRGFSVWSDEQIRPGDHWHPELQRAVSGARTALLLVSPSFLASSFIIEEELPALIETGARLFTVLVRAALWQEEPLLAGVQWAHDPDRDGPVASAADPEGQIASIATRMLRLLPDSGSALEQPSDGSVMAEHAMGAVQALTVDESPGGLYCVPPPPIGLVARDELAGLRDAMLEAASGAAGIAGEPLGVHGEGGIGKTVLASELARGEEIRHHFPDGVFWVTVGEKPDLLALQIDLLARLGSDVPEPRNPSDGLARLRDVLAERHVLLVIDDVWSLAAAQAFRAAGPHGRVLYTTRFPAILAAVGASARQVGALPLDAARQLLSKLTGAQGLPAEADAVIEATGGLALALSLVGAAIAGGQQWTKVLKELDRGTDRFGDHPYANAFKAMQVGISALDVGDAQAYQALAVYPEDTLIPTAALERLWPHLLKEPTDRTDPRLKTLAERKLLTHESDGFRFHDLQRAFLLLHTENLALLHSNLLDAYRNLLPSKDSRWSELPPDEPYIWERLVYHLKGAGDGNGVLALVTDLAYLARRCLRDGPYAPESDLRQVQDLYPHDAAVSWLLNQFTQWGHSLTGLSSVGDLAATLWLRTQAAPAAISRTPLKSLLPPLYLEPRWGLREAPPALRRVLKVHRSAMYGGRSRPTGPCSPPAAPTGWCGCGTWRAASRRVCSRGTPARWMGWRSRLTGPCSPAPAATGRCGCGTRRPASRPARSRVTPASCMGWRSRPTGPCSPARAATEWCGCGTRQAVSSPARSTAISTG